MICTLVVLISAYAPHIAEELWQKLGHEESLAYENWPEIDEKLLSEEELNLVVQVNGKKRGEIRVPTNATKEEIEALAVGLEKVQTILAGRSPKKVIVVPGRLVNVVG